MDYSSTYRGVVKGIHEDYDDKTKVRIEIELPKKPAPKPKKGEPPTSAYSPTRSETVSSEMAAGLKIGDTVECKTTLTKVRRVTRKAGNPGNPGKEKAYA
jgi:hypothetical protein